MDTTNQTEILKPEHLTLNTLRPMTRQEFIDQCPEYQTCITLAQENVAFTILNMAERLMWKNGLSFYSAQVHADSFIAFSLECGDLKDIGMVQNHTRYMLSN